MNNGNLTATVDRKGLADAMKLLGKVVERRNTIPVLSCLLVECDPANNRLTLRGSDLDIFATVSLFATDCQPGSALVPCDQLAKALSKSKGEFARLAAVPGGLAMTLDSGATVRLMTPPKSVPGDYPRPLPGMAQLGEAGLFPAAQLREELARVRVAVSTEETRYYLNGVFAHMLAGQPGRMALAATDGHRLCVQHRDAPAGFTMDDTIIPRKLVNLMVQVMAKRDDAAALAFGKTAMRFELGNVVLESKVIDGTFPDYTRVIPSGRERVLRIDADALQYATKAVTAGISAKTKAVRLSMDSVQGWLTASARDAEGNLSAMQVDGADVEALGKDAEGSFLIGANAAYLAEMAGLFDGTMSLQFGGEGSPFILEGAVRDFRAVIMPMRCDEAPVTPQTIADMNKPAPTPLEVLEADAPALVAALADKGTLAAHDIIRTRLAAIIKAAIDQALQTSVDRRTARLFVLARLAAMAGDMAREDRLSWIIAHQPRATFRAWSAGVAKRLPYAGPTFNAVEQFAESAKNTGLVVISAEKSDLVAQAPEAAPAHVTSPDIAALTALVTDMSARLAVLEAERALRGDAQPQGRPARSEAQAAVIRRAWAERRERRALATRLEQAVGTIETVTAQRNDYRRIAEAETVRADQAEGMVASLRVRVGRLSALVQGRKAKLASMARDLLGARTEAARLTREVASRSEDVPERARGLRTAGGSSYGIGRKRA